NEVKPLGDTVDNQLIVDIGTQTAQDFAENIVGAELVIWNGPMGLAEVPAFAAGTEQTARAVAAAKYSIIGGGDTIAAADRLGLLPQYDFVSTGGGAMLVFLAGEKLPGLESLGYYQ
ncbi:MAG: phosphoglycerate kinase, partial [Patescibacteria group bacterium]